MKRAARAPARLRTSQGGRPCKPAKILPTVRRKDLPTVHLPRQTRSQGGKTKLTNHRAAIILHAISCGCYRETAAELRTGQHHGRDPLALDGLEWRTVRDLPAPPAHGR